MIASRKIDFVGINGENSGDRELELQKFLNLISAGADVVTTGNHVWDESRPRVHKKKRLLRPLIVKGF